MHCDQQAKVINFTISDTHGAIDFAQLRNHSHRAQTGFHLPGPNRVWYRTSIILEAKFVYCPSDHPSQDAWNTFRVNESQEEPSRVGGEYGF